MEKPKILLEKDRHRQYTDLVCIAFLMVDRLISKLTLMGELSPSEERLLKELEDALGEVDLPSLESLKQFYRSFEVPSGGAPPE